MCPLRSRATSTGIRSADQPRTFSFPRFCTGRCHTYLALERLSEIALVYLGDAGALDRVLHGLRQKPVTPSEGDCPVYATTFRRLAQGQILRKCPTVLLPKLFLSEVSHRGACQGIERALALFAPIALQPAHTSPLMNRFVGARKTGPLGGKFFVNDLCRRLFGLRSSEHLSQLGFLLAFNKLTCARKSENSFFFIAYFQKQFTTTQ